MAWREKETIDDEEEEDECEAVISAISPPPCSSSNDDDKSPSSAPTNANDAHDDLIISKLFSNLTGGERYPAPGDASNSHAVPLPPSSSPITLPSTIGHGSESPQRAEDAVVPEARSPPVSSTVTPSGPEVQPPAGELPPVLSSPSSSAQPSTPAPISPPSPYSSIHTIKARQAIRGPRIQISDLLNADDPSPPRLLWDFADHTASAGARATRLWDSDAVSASAHDVQSTSGNLSSFNSPVLCSRPPPPNGLRVSDMDSRFSVVGYFRDPSQPLKHSHSIRHSTSAMRQTVTSHADPHSPRSTKFVCSSDDLHASQPQESEGPKDDPFGSPRPRPVGLPFIRTERTPASQPWGQSTSILSTPEAQVGANVPDEDEVDDMMQVPLSTASE